jgi:hypothetical protein
LQAADFADAAAGRDRALNAGAAEVVGLQLEELLRSDVDG